ncbi:MAG: hypothetical protein EXS63_00765 [Candidatus Omnitrophica bacterium]|nr:hypothetical protein [Candidatus Omnitrophota bacterium]
MDKNHLDFEIKFYENVLRERPAYIEVLMPLAEAYTRKGLFEKGLEIDKRLASLCKKDPVVFYNLGCSYALVGKKKESLKTLKKAVQLGYHDFKHMRKDKDLEEHFGDPAFESLFPKKL